MLFLHQREEHIFKASLAAANLLHFSAFAYDQAHERRHLRPVVQNKHETAVIDGRLRNRSLLSQRGKHGFGKTATGDFSTLTAAARAQLRRTADRKELALPDHCDQVA